MNTQNFVVYGCLLDDLNEGMKCFTEGIQERFEMPVTVKWSVSGTDIYLALSSESEEMSQEDYVTIQVFLEIGGAFEIADEEIGIIHKTAPNNSPR